MNQKHYSIFYRLLQVEYIRNFYILYCRQKGVIEYVE